MNFTSSIQDVDPITKEIKISIPADHVIKKCSDELSSIARTSKIKGFRPGKAPRAMVEKLYGEGVFARVSQQLISDSLYDVVREKAIDMVGNPAIDVAQLEQGKQIDFTAKVSVLPKPEVTGYDKIDVSVKQRKVEDAQVEEFIQKLRERRATIQGLQFRNTAKKGDVVEGQLSIAVSGDAASRPEPFVGVLGDNRLPAEVESKIEGLEIGQKAEVSVQHGDDAQVRELAGKEATYSFTLSALHERVLPELTDDFAKESGVEGAQTVLDLRVKTRERLEKESEDEAKSDVQQAILEKLLSLNDFQIPEALIDHEIRLLLVRSGLVDPKKVDVERINAAPFREHFGETAGKRVKTAILVDRVAQQENLSLSDDDRKKAYAEFAEGNGVTAEDVERYFSSPERRPSFDVELLRNKVLDMLVERTKVSYETV